MNVTRVEKYSGHIISDQIRKKFILPRIIKNKDKIRILGETISYPPTKGINISLVEEKNVGGKTSELFYYQFKILPEVDLTVIHTLDALESDMVKVHYIGEWLPSDYFKHKFDISLQFVLNEDDAFIKTCVSLGRLKDLEIASVQIPKDGEKKLTHLTFGEDVNLVRQLEFRFEQ